MSEEALFSQGHLATLTKALNSTHRLNTHVLAGAGSIRPENMSGLDTAADTLIRLEGVETAIVFALKDGTLSGVLKTRSGTVDPHKWITSLFSFTEDDVYSFGEDDDEKSTCHFTIPLGLLGKCPDKSQLWDIANSYVTNLFVEKVGVEE